jgi:hypothetical protein
LAPHRLISNFITNQLDGTYWSVAGVTDDYPLQSQPAYSRDFVRDFIAPVRIDLDVFSEGERAVLENHGYLMAETAIRSHTSQVAPAAPKARPPFSDWLDERRAADALRDSAKTKIFPRERIRT